jgi:hypothetical protein
VISVTTVLIFERGGRGGVLTPVMKYYKECSDVVVSYMQHIIT